VSNEHPVIDPLRPQAAPVAHEWRTTDVDPRAERRAELQIAGFFGASALLVLLSVVFYVATPITDFIALPVLGDVNASNALVGTCWGLAIFFIGIGAIHWAKKLMPDVEVVEDRHEMRSSDEDRDDVARIFEVGAAESGLGSRKIIRRSLLGAMALFPLPLVVLLRDLGPSPSSGALTRTIWKDGVRLVTDVTYEPIKPDDIPLGGLVNAVPENLRQIEEEQGTLNERAKAVIILVKIAPDQIVGQQGGTPSAPWDYNGVLAYSKVCTHMGCPISLYEKRTHHLLCPCHQSTFDLADAGRVVFGPAARNMPQLPITVDAEGYLVARSDFQEPVGPSFWERA
jgi:ubiquinol-cytochrome c reductase iron-sulfur subunit